MQVTVVYYHQEDKTTEEYLQNFAALTWRLITNLLHLVPSVAGLKASRQESEAENIFLLPNRHSKSLMTVDLANQIV